MVTKICQGAKVDQQGYEDVRKLRWISMVMKICQGAKVDQQGYEDMSGS